MVVERRWGVDVRAQTLVVYRDAMCIHLANTVRGFSETTGGKQELNRKIRTGRLMYDIKRMALWNIKTLKKFLPVG